MAVRYAASRFPATFQEFPFTERKSLPNPSFEQSRNCEGVVLCFLSLFGIIYNANFLSLTVLEFSTVGEMVNCSRCCLNLGLRTVNLAINFCGMGMIIYSIWLLKNWRDEVAAEMGPGFVLPHPWFIYTCLGVGILVCLSTLSGHMVANSTSITVLSVYILFVCFILFLQIGVIVEIYFRKNWQDAFWKDFEDNDNLKTFFTFHLKICRYIGVIILLAQANAVTLAIILWALGPELRSHCNGSSNYRAIRPELDQSFLVRPDSQPSQPALAGLAQFRRNLQEENGGNIAEGIR